MTEAVKGALVALALSPLVTLVFAYTFRIPIPFACYIGPFGEINSYSMSISEVVTSVLIAWMFYMMLGGIFVVPLCGAILGALVGHRYANSKFKSRIVLLSSALACAGPIFVMSILDLLIGPW